MTSMVKTAILMAALTALFLIGGQALAGRSGMTIALGVALAMNFFTYWCSDKIALAMNRARQVSESEAPNLHHQFDGRSDGWSDQLPGEHARQ